MDATIAIGEDSEQVVSHISDVFAARLEIGISHRLERGHQRGSLLVQTEFGSLPLRGDSVPHSRVERLIRQDRLVDLKDGLGLDRQFAVNRRNVFRQMAPRRLDHDSPVAAPEVEDAIHSIELGGGQRQDLFDVLRVRSLGESLDPPVGVRLP